ncbi:hypothetical protein BDN72DRAFT_275348 [Pluteus cervinus]|uniref:Uncharacterized protein n=1 Tax=Pluteus cervinus TaxID=181527 RepID=A0ACD3AFT1_9AGAR|nr:hypothetical protein BDN72DRAFT_275348 [Pluteus cervinus]
MTELPFLSVTAHKDQREVELNGHPRKSHSRTVSNTSAEARARAENSKMPKLSKEHDARKQEPYPLRPSREERPQTASGIRSTSRHLHRDSSKQPSKLRSGSIVDDRSDNEVGASHAGPDRRCR